MLFMIKLECDTGFFHLHKEISPDELFKGISPGEILDIRHSGKIPKIFRMNVGGLPENIHDYEISFNEDDQKRNLSPSFQNYSSNEYKSQDEQEEYDEYNEEHINDLSIAIENNYDHSTINIYVLNQLQDEIWLNYEFDSHWNCYCKTRNVCGCGCDSKHDGWA